MMKIYNLLGFIISFILAFVCYFSTSNIFIGAGVLVGSVAFYFIFIYKKILFNTILIVAPIMIKPAFTKRPPMSYKTNTTKIQECYIFLNNFLVSLSIKGSISAAIESTMTSVSDEFLEYMESISELTPEEKLLYLNKYFNLHTYQIFVDVVFLWLEEGGDILNMSSHITNEMREIQEYVTYSKSVSRRKAVEISTLWLFSLAIVIALKFSLNDYYSSLLKKPIFIGAVILLAMLVLLSLYILVSRVTNLEVRRSNQNG